MESQIAYIFDTQEFELSDEEEEVSSDLIEVNDEEYWDAYYSPVNTAPTWIPISPELLTLVKNSSH